MPLTWHSSKAGSCRASVKFCLQIICISSSGRLKNIAQAVTDICPHTSHFLVWSYSIYIPGLRPPNMVTYCPDTFTKGNYSLGLSSWNLFAGQVMGLGGQVHSCPPCNNASWGFSLSPLQICHFAGPAHAGRGYEANEGAWEGDLPRNRLSMPRISALQPSWQEKRSIWGLKQ